MASLEEYRRKRDFKRTPEPAGQEAFAVGQRRFVIQRHAATHLHFDFRLEISGVLKSWALPKGPPLVAKEKRLAVATEDHPLNYIDFEGQIPEGQYGAGTVQIWDQGTFEPNGDPQTQLDKGKLSFTLKGKRLTGHFTLVRTFYRPNSWLLIAKEVKVKPSSELGFKGRLAKSLTPTQMPTAVKPMLAVLVDAPFSSDDWFYEVKLDGVRALAFINEGNLRLLSRNQKDITPQFPELKEILAQVNAKQAILDGEIVAFNERGLTSFQKLQRRLGVTDKVALAALQVNIPVNYLVFDLLYLDGYDLRNLPLTERRQALAETIKQDTRLQVVDFIQGHGEELFNLAKEKGYEGIVAKNKHSRYEEKRSPNWKKIKAVLSQEFVIGGYTAPRGGRQYFGSLLLGVYDNDSLVYAGHTGTGFDEQALAKIFQLMQPLRTEHCPFQKEPKTNEKPYWLKPELVAEVKFTQWTRDGFLRHPSFVGLRFDKEPRECRREVKKSLPLALTAVNVDEQEVEIEQKKLKLTNLNKVFWPTAGFTKRDLIEYYNQVADWLLPHLKDRPMVLKRYPNGIKGKYFFQKDAPPEAPGWIKTKPIFETDHTNNYIIVNDKATLIYLINLACIDLHPWSSRVNTLDNPDWLSLDLDPFDAPFSQVVKVAQTCHKLFSALGLTCYLKTSGATGLHLFVPLEPIYSYKQARMLAEIVARLVVEQEPKLATIEHDISKREGKVYIDYLQNVRGKTLASVYSVRPQAQAPVSTPLKWEELNEALNPLEFNLKTVMSRLESQGDLFAPVLTKKQKITVNALL